MPRWLALLALSACVESTLTALDDDHEGDDPGECADDADNDRDGLFDCDDPDCEGSSACADGEDTDTDDTDTDDTDTDDSDTDTDDTDTDDSDTDTDTAPPVQDEVLTTPGSHDVVVPAGITSVTLRMWGGGGAGGSQADATGGAGAYVTAVLPVTPGETLTVEVAEGGDSTGDGGGASILSRGATVLAVAAGGGGGGSDGNSGNSMGGGSGGAGGGAAGEAGTGLTSTPGYAFCTAATGGEGGTQNAGGTGGTPTGTGSSQCDGGDGDTLAGGASWGVNGTCQTTGAQRWASGGGQANGGGGGGGAGWYGGGGAGFVWTYCGGGGGGGSSWVTSGATAVTLLGGTGQDQPRAVASQGAGRGGDRAYDVGLGRYVAGLGVGADGRVELDW